MNAILKAEAGAHDGDPNIVDITGLNPQPKLWWTYDGTTFTEPPDLANRRALEGKAANALNANATFLGLAQPTNAQTLAQVQALTRQVTALIRLVTDQLDSTAGT